MTEKKDSFVGLRIEESLLKRIDRHKETMVKESPGLRVGRSDAIRVLLLKGLEQVEKPKRKRKRN